MNDITWEFSHASFGNMAATYVTHRTQIDTQVPCVELLSEKMVASGYMRNADYPIYLYRTTTFDGRNPEYAIICSVRFDKGDGSLMWRVQSEGYANILHAIERAAALLARCFYNGEPIEMGKGQMGKCKAIALRLATEHAAYLDESSLIVVPSESRGGRGGWKTKIADRRFTVNELLNPVKKEVKPAIMVVGNYYSDWRGMWLQKDEKVKIELTGEKVNMRYMSLMPCIDGDLVVLNSGDHPVFRFSIADWQRLLSKQQKEKA